MKQGCTKKYTNTYKITESFSSKHIKTQLHSWIWMNAAKVFPHPQGPMSLIVMNNYQHRNIWKRIWRLDEWNRKYQYEEGSATRISIEHFEKNLSNLSGLSINLSCLSTMGIAWASAGNEESGWHQPRLILILLLIVNLYLYLWLYLYLYLTQHWQEIMRSYDISQD